MTIAQVLFELYGTVSMVTVRETQGVGWYGAATEALMLTGKQTMMEDSLQFIVYSP